MTQSSAAKDVTDYIDSQGVATLGVDLFAFELSQDVDKQAVIVDTGGIMSTLPEVYEQVTIQLLIRGGRGEPFIAVNDFARQIHNLLISTHVNANTNDYKEFTPTGQGAPSFIGRDSEDRILMSCNYYAYRNPF